MRANAGYDGYPVFPTDPLGELYTQRVEAIPTRRLARTGNTEKQWLAERCDIGNGRSLPGQGGVQGDAVICRDPTRRGQEAGATPCLSQATLHICGCSDLVSKHAH